MPLSECYHCGHLTLKWYWEEAFDEFGFVDGDGQIMTWEVEHILTKHGYEVFSDQWGMRNVVIKSIKKNGTELIPNYIRLGHDVRPGYDNPRDYLPDEIIKLLDEKFPK